MLRSSHTSSNPCCDVYFPLLRQSQHITQNHYEDVVEERNIEWLCGYPMCDRKLGPISRQKYHISVERQQVFDLTERKVGKSCQRLLQLVVRMSIVLCFRSTAVVSATRLPSSSGHSCQQCQCGQELASECIPLSAWSCFQATFCILQSKVNVSVCPIVESLLSSSSHQPAGNEYLHCYYVHWLSTEDASRTTGTEQAISQGGDVCSPSSGDPPPHGGGDMTADTQSSPGVAAMRVDTQPREVDSVGQSLRSLQLVEHSIVCDQSTAAVAEQNAPTTATCPVSTMTVTSSMAKLQHAMSNWCTPATWAYLQGDEGVGQGGGGGRGEEKLELPFLPAVHSVGQAQLQRNIFMQQLKRKSVNHDILMCMNVFNILLSFSLSEIDGCLTGVTAHQVLPALTELVRTFK